MQAIVQNKTLHPANRATEIWTEKHEGETVEVRLVSAAQRRSLDANAKYWQWCHLIEVELGYETGHVHRYNKWNFGLPILTREHPEYRERLLAMLRPLDYERRLQAMDLIACTSQFNRTEMKEYMDSVQKHWIEQAGIELE